MVLGKLNDFGNMQDSGGFKTETERINTQVVHFYLANHFGLFLDAAEIPLK